MARRRYLQCRATEVVRDVSQLVEIAVANLRLKVEDFLTKFYAWLAAALPKAACAAARRAIGTRNGEQDT